MASPVKITFEEAMRVRRMAAIINQIMDAGGSGQSTHILRDEYAQLRAEFSNRHSEAPRIGASDEWKPSDFEPVEAGGCAPPIMARKAEPEA